MGKRKPHPNYLAYVGWMITQDASPTVIVLPYEAGKEAAALTHCDGNCADAQWCEGEGWTLTVVFPEGGMRRIWLSKDREKAQRMAPLKIAALK